MDIHRAALPHPPGKGASRYYTTETARGYQKFLRKGIRCGNEGITIGYPTPLDP